MPVSELKARLDIKELPDEDKGRYNTLAGMLMAGWSILVLIYYSVRDRR